MKIHYITRDGEELTEVHGTKVYAYKSLCGIPEEKLNGNYTDIEEEVECLRCQKLLGFGEFRII